MGFVDNNTNVAYCQPYPDKVDLFHILSKPPKLCNNWPQVLQSRCAESSKRQKIRRDNMRSSVAMVWEKKEKRSRDGAWILAFSDHPF